MWEEGNCNVNTKLSSSWIKNTCFFKIVQENINILCHLNAYCRSDDKDSGHNSDEDLRRSGPEKPTQLGLDDILPASRRGNGESRF